MFSRKGPMGTAREIPVAAPHRTCYQCGSRSLIYTADDGHHKCMICGRPQRVVPEAFGGEFAGDEDSSALIP